MVSTKTAERRTLRFGRMDDIEAEINRLDQAANVRNTGNWTPAQVVQHITKFIEWSLDGFPFKAPWFIRMLGPRLRDRVLIRPTKPGFKFPKSMAAAAPDADVTWQQAMGQFQACMKRIRNGARMKHPSPAFGELNHEQWSQLHCRHAELHLSFLHPVDAASEDAVQASDERPVRSA